MDLLTRLKEFYLLESYQVEFYKKHIQFLKSTYLRKVYELLVKIEQSHVDYFKEAIEKYGGEIPVLTEKIISHAGGLVGLGINLTQIKNAYDLGITFESKAIEMYRMLIIETVKEPELNKKLWDFMIEEEFHLLWFKQNHQH
ncbi:MAG: hypothetical protein ACOX4L_00010 [Bacillota bacterium]|jgi:rubrerythrin